MTFFLGLGVLETVRVAVRGWEPGFGPSPSPAPAPAQLPSSSVPLDVTAAKPARVQGMGILGLVRLPP